MISTQKGNLSFGLGVGATALDSRDFPGPDKADGVPPHRSRFEAGRRRSERPRRVVRFGGIWEGQMSGVLPGEAGVGVGTVMFQRKSLGMVSSFEACAFSHVSSFPV